MPIEKLYPKFTLTEEKIEELKSILPEVFADGKINWESLRESLGEFLEEDEQDTEHFGLFWPGKRDAKKLASIPSTGTLIPAKGEGVDEENTKNIFIEGENLDVLKILQKSYANSIKMIYIDPPYNTGNDFIYEDDFTETIDEYLKRTGQMDEEGKPMTTNKKSNGRFHSKWLSMMYPRLKMARNLLKDDGVIFISIDDNEVYNLREIMNEIYGEENFISSFIWKKRSGGGYSNTIISTNHEYILCYGKNENSEFHDKEKTTDWVENYYNCEDKISKYKRRDMRKSGTGDRRIDRPTMYYEVKAPDGSKIFPLKPNGEEGRWSLGKATFENLSKDEFEFIKVKNVWKIYLKERSITIKGVQKTEKYESILVDVPLNSEGTSQIEELFGDKNIFPFPKPTGLIRKFLEMASREEDIILDFFAGSGTTAQAVWELNKKDNSDRKFILIQMPELCEKNTEAFKAKLYTIADICKERIRRVIKKLKNEKKLELGFKVYKLAKSNYKAWQNYEGEDIKKLETLFERYESPLIDKWKEENLITEIVLLEGFPLDSSIGKLKEFKENDIKIVTSDYHEHKLLICLDKKIKKGTIENLDLIDKDVFICLDSAITDEEKMTLSDKGLIKTI